MTGPPIRVTFDASNQDPVVAAIRELGAQLRAIRNEARETAGATKATTQGFEAMQAGAQRTSAAANRLRDGLNGVFQLLAVGSLARFAKDSLEAADSLGKLSQRTGASVESLSVLTLAAKTADLSQEDLATGLARLSRSFSELQAGSPKATAAFRRIGLSAAELKGLSLDQVLVRIADAFATFADGPQKAAAAMAIFGRTGDTMLPLLNDLANGGFAQLERRARELGLVITKDTARAAQDFNDNLEVLRLQAQGLARDILTDVLPALNRLFTRLSTGLGDADPLAKSLLGTGAGVLLGGAGVAGIARLLGAGAASGPLGLTIAALATIALTLDDIAEASRRANQSFDDFLKTSTDPKALAESFNATKKLLDANLAAQRDTEFLLGINPADQILQQRIERLRAQERILRDALVALTDRTAQLLAPPAARDFDQAGDQTGNLEKARRDAAALLQLRKEQGALTTAELEKLHLRELEILTTLKAQTLSVQEELRLRRELAEIIRATADLPFAILRQPPTPQLPIGGPVGPVDLFAGGNRVQGSGGSANLGDSNLAILGRGSIGDQGTGPVQGLLAGAGAARELQKGLEGALTSGEALALSLSEAARGSLAEFFRTGITGAESLGEAFRNLVTSVVDALLEISSQLLALELVEALGLPSLPFAGGGPVRRAAGGVIPGSGSGDTVPALLTPGEFVIRRDIVNAYGLEFMRALNTGLVLPPIRTVGPMRFADGGPVGRVPAQGGSSGRFSGRIGLDRGLFWSDVKQDPEDLLDVVSSNRGAFRERLGIR